MWVIILFIHHFSKTLWKKLHLFYLFFIDKEKCIPHFKLMKNYQLFTFWWFKSLYPALTNMSNWCNLLNFITINKYISIKNSTFSTYVTFDNQLQEAANQASAWTMRKNYIQANTDKTKYMGQWPSHFSLLL